MEDTFATVASRLVEQFQQASTTPSTFYAPLWQAWLMDQRRRSRTDLFHQFIFWERWWPLVERSHDLIEARLSQLRGADADYARQLWQSREQLAARVQSLREQQHRSDRSLTPEQLQQVTALMDVLRYVLAGGPDLYVPLRGLSADTLQLLASAYQRAPPAGANSPPSKRHKSTVVIVADTLSGPSEEEDRKKEEVIEISHDIESSDVSKQEKEKEEEEDVIALNVPEDDIRSEYDSDMEMELDVEPRASTTEAWLRHHIEAAQESPSQEEQWRTTSFVMRMAHIAMLVYRAHARDLGHTLESTDTVILDPAMLSQYIRDPSRLQHVHRVWRRALHADRAQRLLVPVHSDTHWMLAVVLVRRRVLVFENSLGPFLSSLPPAQRLVYVRTLLLLAESLRQFQSSDRESQFEANTEQLRKWRVFQGEPLRQRDTRNCGNVVALLLMIYIKSDVDRLLEERTAELPPLVSRVDLNRWEHLDRISEQLQRLHEAVSQDVERANRADTLALLPTEMLPPNVRCTPDERPTMMLGYELLPVPDTESLPAPYQQVDTKDVVQRFAPAHAPIPSKGPGPGPVSSLTPSELSLSVSTIGSRPVANSLACALTFMRQSKNEEAVDEPHTLVSPPLSSCPTSDSYQLVFAPLAQGAGSPFERSLFAHEDQALHQVATASEANAQLVLWHNARHPHLSVLELHACGPPPLRPPKTKAMEELRVCTAHDQWDVRRLDVSTKEEEEEEEQEKEENENIQSLLMASSVSRAVDVLRQLMVSVLRSTLASRAAIRFHLQVYLKYRQTQGGTRVRFALLYVYTALALCPESDGTRLHRAQIAQLLRRHQCTKPQLMSLLCRVLVTDFNVHAALTVEARVEWARMQQIVREMALDRYPVPAIRLVEKEEEEEEEEEKEEEKEEEEGKRSPSKEEEEETVELAAPVLRPADAQHIDATGLVLRVSLPREHVMDRQVRELVFPHTGHASSSRPVEDLTRMSMDLLLWYSDVDYTQVSDAYSVLQWRPIRMDGREVQIEMALPASSSSSLPSCLCLAIYARFQPNPRHRYERRLRLASAAVELSVLREAQRSETTLVMPMLNPSFVQGIQRQTDEVLVLEARVLGFQATASDTDNTLDAFVERYTPLVRDWWDQYMDVLDHQVEPIKKTLAPMHVPAFPSTLTQMFMPAYALTLREPRADRSSHAFVEHLLQAQLHSAHMTPTELTAQLAAQLDERDARYHPEFFTGMVQVTYLLLRLSLQCDYLSDEVDGQVSETFKVGSLTGSDDCEGLAWLACVPMYKRVTLWQPTAQCPEDLREALRHVQQALEHYVPVLVTAGATAANVTQDNKSGEKQSAHDQELQCHIYGLLVPLGLLAQWMGRTDQVRETVSELRAWDWLHEQLDRRVQERLPVMLVEGTNDTYPWLLPLPEQGQETGQAPTHQELMQALIENHDRVARLMTQCPRLADVAHTTIHQTNLASQVPAFERDSFYDAAVGCWPVLPSSQLDGGRRFEQLLRALCSADSEQSFALDLLWSYDLDGVALRQELDRDSVPKALRHREAVTEAREQSHVLNGTDLEDVFHGHPAVGLVPLVPQARAMVDFCRLMLRFEPPLLTYVELADSTSTESQHTLAILEQWQREFTTEPELLDPQSDRYRELVLPSFFARTRFYVRPFVQLDLGRIEALGADELQELHHWLECQRSELLALSYRFDPLNLSCQWLQLTLIMRHTHPTVAKPKTDRRRRQRRNTKQN